jgi:serine protease Do
MFSKTKSTKLKKSYRSFRYTGFLRCALLIVGIWCASILVTLAVLAPQQVYAQDLASIPGGNVSDPVVRAVDIAKPAVVRILTSLNGHLAVHFPPTTDVSFPQQSNGSYPLLLSGTGMFINSQGDILTADHVVQPPKDQQLDQALYAAAAQDVANYINQNAKSGSTPVSPSDVTQQLTSGQLQSTTSYDTPTSRIYMSTDYVGTYTASDISNVPSNSTAAVDIIKAQSPSNQQDIAIVHVPMTDTPSIALGNSDNVQQQDQLTVIGFPGNADVSQKPQDFLTSSISSVYVSSKKTSDSGAPLIQIGGNVNHGNSGGPALDSQGAIVGVVSFGITDGTSDTISGTSFLQASSSAIKLAQSINLTMTPGTFQTQWSQAFNDYSATTSGHWHKAAQEFTQLAHSYPQFQAVQQFLSYAQTQARSEVVASPTATHNAGSAPHTSSPSTAASSSLTSWQAWALAIGAVVLLFALAISLFAVAIRRKRKHSTALAPKVAPGRNTPSVIAAPNSATIKDRTSADRAIGDIPATPVRPQPVQSGATSATNTGVGQNTLSLKVWPCGHMNRSNARFCSICGEPAPLPPGKG